MTKKINSGFCGTGRCILLLLLCLWLGASVAAAAPSDEEQALKAQQREEQLQRSRQQEEERQRRQQGKDVFLQPPGEAQLPETMPQDEVSFLIRKIVLDGSANRAPAWLQTDASIYEGRKIGKDGINYIIKKLNAKLLAEGYITSRVMVPEQNLSSGELHLTIMMGRIGDIRFSETVRGVSWKSAFPCRSGDVLNLRDLEQGLEQMKRVPSQDVDFQLVPGKQTGESDVVIQLKRSKNWKLSWSLDDSGSKSTGRLQSSYTFGLDNLMGMNDLLSVVVNQDGQRQGELLGTEGNSLYFSFPNGYWTYSFSMRSSNYHQTLPGTSGALLRYSGESWNFEAKAEKLLQRSQTAKRSIYLKMLQSKSRNYLEGVEIEVQRKTTTALEVGLSGRQYQDKDVWDWQVAYRHGMPWLQAMEDYEGPESTTTRYGLWTGEISWRHPFKIGGRDARYTATLRGQYSNSRLNSIDCFSIGNRYTVRGFDGEQTLCAEKGWFLQNEVALTVDEKGREFYIGFDFGEVAGPSAQYLSGRNLSGAVFGFRGALTPGCYLDAFVGWSLSKPQGFTSSNPTGGFQLTWQL